MLELVALVLFVTVIVLGYINYQFRQQIKELNENKTELRNSVKSLTQKLDLQLKSNERQITSIKNLEAELSNSKAIQEKLEIALNEHKQNTQNENVVQTALYDVAHDPLLVVNPKQQIIKANQQATTTFELDNFSVQKLGDIDPTGTLSMMVEQALINHEDTFEEQLTIGERTYRVGALVKSHEDTPYVGLSLQDITQLIRLNRARRDMVANISHELRTPIANIRLTIDGLFHDQDKPKRKDSISSLKLIAQETDNLLWLVQEMADLSMIESGQAIVRLVEVSLATVVDEAIARLENQSQAYDVKIVKHIPEKIFVLCDRDLIQRVIVNLLHNGLKWSPKKDAITISAAEEDEEVIISVLDNGPGVPEDQVDRIFERFYQTDASRSGQDGTGLGLAICRHIVQAHGGRVWAEDNANGAGGRFRFTLLNVKLDEEHESDTISNNNDANPA